MRLTNADMNKKNFCKTYIKTNPDIKKHLKIDIKKC